MIICYEILICVVEHTGVCYYFLRVDMSPAVICFCQTPRVVAAARQVVDTDYGNGFTAAAVEQIINQSRVMIARASSVFKRLNAQVLGCVVVAVAIADIINIVIDSAEVNV